MRYLDDSWQPTKNKIVGCTFTNTNNKEYKVICAYYQKERKVYKFKIKFIDSGYEKIAYRNDVVKGLIRDRIGSQDVYGVASLGYASVTGNEQEYRVWNGFIKRCYSEKCDSYSAYGGSGVRVCKRWLRFDYFLEDINQIDGYDETLFFDGKLELDKDIKQFHLEKSRRLYSLNTCKFVSRKENDKYRDYSNNNRIKIVATYIDGTKEKHNSITDFSKRNQLNKSSVARALRLNKSHKGWKFERIEE